MATVSVVATAVGDFIVSNWPILSAIAIGCFAACKYFDTRKRELAWRRTVFIFEQARLLDTDPDLSEAVAILEDRHLEVQLDNLYALAKDTCADAALSRYRQKMDRLLNFLDRLAYATCDARTLSVSEVGNFGWYFEKVAKHPSLADYCKKNGFGDIISLAERLQTKNTKKE